MSFIKKIASTSGKIEPLTLKQVVLKKHTYHAQKTEEYFKMAPQPAITCPMIDEAKEVNDSYGTKIQGLILAAQAMVSHSLLEENSCCENHNNFRKNQESLNKMIFNLEENLELIKQINEYLEIIRQSCKDYRKYGSKLKNLLWQGIGEQTLTQEFISNRDNLQNNKPEVVFSGQELVRMYRELNKLSIELLDSACMEKCDNYSKNMQLMEISQQYQELSLEVPKSLGRALQNFDRMVNWCEELLELINSDNIHHEQMKLEKLVSDYLVDRNEYQIKKLESYVKSINEEPLTLLDWRAKLSFSRVPENLDPNTIKDIDHYVDRINLLIAQTNKFCKEYELDSSKAEEEFRQLNSLANEIFSQIPSFLPKSLSEVVKHLKNYFEKQFDAHGYHKFTVVD